MAIDWLLNEPGLVPRRNGWDTGAIRTDGLERGAGLRATWSTLHPSIQG